MSRSTYTMEHFNHQRARLGIRQGLENIGETRFGTIYWSALSVQHWLPAFAAIAEKHDIMVRCERPKLGQLQLTLRLLHG